jgi:iron complex outermembrane receptor protein
MKLMSSLAQHSAFFVLAAASISAHAQTTPSVDPKSPEAGSTQAAGPRDGIQDIVVTARRTSESLQKTPISITALSSDTLEKINVTQVDKVAQIAPNLVISQQSSSLSAASINIRGIGQTDPSLALDTAVGVYLDGVYVARSAGSIFDLVDLERLEVLRGPQGTLFGRNTTGGAIQLVSKKPQEEFGVTVKGGYGTRNNWFGRGRIDSGEIGESGISAAFSYYHRQRDGYFDNLYTKKSKDPGSLNVDALTASLHGDFGAIQVNYGYDYDNRTGTPAFFQTVSATPDALAYYSRSPANGGVSFQFIGPDKRLTEGYQLGYDGKIGSQSISQGHNLTMSYEVSPALTVRSISGYRKLNIGNVLSLSGQGDLKGPVVDFTSPTLVSVQSVHPYDGRNDPQKQDQFSEELQATGSAGEFSYVAGLYYFTEKASELNEQRFTLVLRPAALPFLGFPGAVADAITAQGYDLIGLNLTPVAAYRSKSISYAAFGQVSWKPSSIQGLELTGGIRYTKDKKRLTLLNSTGGVPDIGNGTDRASFNNVSWLGSASYQFTPEILGYAKVSTGYKSGGFNPRAPGTTDASGVFSLNSFDPEKLISYEAGFKTDLFDRKLRINVAGFYSKYDDLQVPQFASGTGGASTLLVNAGKAEFKGVEVEITAIPVHGLTLNGSLGYTDPTYKSFLFLDPNTNTISNIAKTARFPNVAKFNSYVAAEYQFDPMSFGQVSARLSYAYRSHVYFYPNDAVNPFQRDVDSPATNNVDARLAVTDIGLGGRARGELALIGENLLNEDQVVYGIDFSALGTGGKFYSEPRRISVEFKVSF